ncbi:MAG TPA: twin-arginine translocation pathway signal, partial [Vicinamibacteria bacterium]|nr:twin-arginine translocation pathway signal [Vicinamibacteria bacterium]
DVEPREAEVIVRVIDGERGPVVVVSERAIVAMPRFVARRVVRPLRDRDDEGFTYGAWMVANLHLDSRPTSAGYPLAWDNVLYDSPSLGYVVATHQSGRDHGPTVLTYYLPLLDEDPAAARRRLLATAWEEWVDTILADLGRAHPGIGELVENVDVYLWGHAMVRPRPGFLWSAALAASARPLGRLRFAHTDLSGMALFEEAQHWGIRAAASILEEEGRHVPPELRA